MTRRIAVARWHKRVEAAQADDFMRGWLVDQASLTSKLIASCGDFRVRRISQRTGRCHADEAETIGLRRVRQVREREVLLLCDGVPVVYAHTVVPLDATASDWPFFGALGERSLGTTLFGDPRVQRGAMEFAHLHGDHPLVKKAAEALCVKDLQTPLHARRCLYRRRRGLLLVTEVFLPSIARLRRGSAADKEAE